MRRQRKQQPLPAEEVVSDLDDAEAALAERLDGAHYRDDILRLLFICCHPDLPATQQIALALRIVSGLSVKEIARAFLVEREPPWSSASPAPSAGSRRPTCRSRRPGAVERAERLAAVAAMIYLLFNEGYSASGGEAHVRAPLCDEAIRLARLLLRLFQAEPEIMGLTALLLLQHARTPARLDADGAIVLLEDQDRSLWDRKMIAEGLALIDKAMRHRRPGPYQVQAAIAALHAQAARPEDTDWAQIDLLYAALERLQPSPVVTLNRAVAVAKVRGPAAALAMIEPLADAALRLLPFLRREGRPAAAARPHRGGARRLRPGHRARQHAAEAAHIRMHLDRLMQGQHAGRPRARHVIIRTPATSDSSCPRSSRASTSFLLRRGSKTWMAGTSPAMTIAIGEKFRSRCREAGASFVLGVSLT